MEPRFEPTDINMDLFPIMQAKAAQFGIELERMDDQVYGLTPLPMPNIITGECYAIKVAFARDKKLQNNTFLRTEWFLNLPPYYNPNVFLTQYCRQWGYPVSDAWVHDAPPNYSVGGFVDPSQRAYAVKWFKAVTGTK